MNTLNQSLLYLSRVFSPPHFGIPESCRPLSITVCSFLYRLKILRIKRFCCHSFLFRNSRTETLYALRVHLSCVTFPYFLLRFPLFVERLHTTRRWNHGMHRIVCKILLKCSVGTFKRLSFLVSNLLSLLLQLFQSTHQAKNHAESCDATTGRDS